VDWNEKAREITVELYDDRNAPNREPFTVHTIAHALQQAYAEGLEDAERVARQPWAPTDYAERVSELICARIRALKPGREVK
jgi:hypothetical protein